MKYEYSKELYEYTKLISFTVEYKDEKEEQTKKLEEVLASIESSLGGGIYIELEKEEINNDAHRRIYTIKVHENNVQYVLKTLKSLPREKYDVFIEVYYKKT